MKNEDIYKGKEFAAYCLARYYQHNRSDLRLALAALKESEKSSVEFLEQFFQKKNEDKETADNRINAWKKKYAQRRSIKSGLKKSRIPLLILLLAAGGYLVWKYAAVEKEETLSVNHDKLFVITTSGFRAHDRPSFLGGYRRYFKYGDTVTNLHDTLNGWLKFNHQDKELYGPAKYFVTEDVFLRYDSLFKDFHYNRTLETVNSKAAFCVYDFIDKTLHSSLGEWHIPLQSQSEKQVHHAVLSLPKAVDYVRIPGEGDLEKYHLLLISRRNIISADSVNHYVLLLELLPNGSVIKKEDFPLSITESSCYIEIVNFDRYLRGIVANNVYLKTDERKLLRLVWKKGMEAPKWEWVE